jgi:phage terminase small subunit
MKVASVKHRLFVDYYFLAKCNVVRAAELAGVPLRTAHSIIVRPEIKLLIEQRQADLAATTMFGASEVVALLISQARSDIADLMPDEPILKEARKNGLSRQVKKIKIKETVRRVQSEESEGEEEEVIDRNVELEMYSAQDALKTLARIFGLDAQDELERGRTAIKMYCEMKDCGPEEAIIALAPHVPAVIKVKDEFLRQKQLGDGSAAEGEVVE